MDTSNRLKFVLGSLEIPASELQASEWLTVVKKALDICKPYLEYLSGFKPIAESLNSCRCYDRRCTDKSVMEFPEGFSEKTRCSLIARLSHEVEGECPPPGYGVRFVRERNILLSQKGKWVLWNFKYERVGRDGLGYRRHRTGIDEVAQFSKFSWIKELELLLLLEQSPQLGKEIIGTLYSLAVKGVEERILRLQQIQWVEKLLAEILRRIK